MSTFASLRVPAYRTWAAGAVVSNIGTWMQRIGQDWLVLTQLTDRSGVALGVVTALQFAPMLLLAPVSGMVADQFDKRRVLLVTQTVSGLTALVLGLAVLTDVVQLWHVYVLAGLLGCASALDAPARQTFVAQLVPDELLANAVSLNSASFHTGRLVGPAVAGLLIDSLGTAVVFLANAASFGAVLFSLSRLSEARLRPMERAAREPQAIRAGIAYLRQRPDLVLVITLVGMIGTFGLNYQLTTALMATTVFHRSAGAYGLLGTMMAVGALGGALAAARRARPSLRLLLVAATAFGLASMVAAAMPTYTSFALSLIPVGLASLTFMTAANAMVQMSTEPAMRGRVMAIYMMVFMGGTPVGSPLIGWVGETFGARWTIVIGGVVSLLSALVIGAALAHRHRQPPVVTTTGGAG